MSHCQAESRLAEHRDLPEALHLRSVPDYTTLYRLLQRLDDDAVKQQIALAQRARQGPWVDTRALLGLVDAAARRAPLRLVLADAEFDSEANHLHIRHGLRAQRIIPAQPRRGFRKERCAGRCYRNFPQTKYGQRAKVESVFSVVKRKLVGTRSGPSLGHANPTSPPPRTHLQPLSLEASLHL